MQRHLAALIIAAVTLAGCGKSIHFIAHPKFPQGLAASDAGPVPQAQLPRVAIPIHYSVALTVDPTQQGFSGHDEIAVDIKKAVRTLYIDGNQLKLLKAVVRTGHRTILASYRQVDKSGVALLSFAGEVPAGPATLVFDYTAPFNQALSGLYKVSVRGDSYAFTQFENTDARRAFPGFDEPGFKTPFDVTITAPASDKVIANTPVIDDSGAGNGMMRWTFETTKPLPTYLIAIAVGPLDIVDMGDIPANQYRDHPLHLRGIAARGMGPKLQYALSLTPSVIDALEAYYGIGYPFQKLDILAVPDFAAGAMENAGAVTFREQLLLMDANAPLDQKRSSLDVQAHELAHQWFGDYVTPEWWDDIWLNEAFATWMENKISATVRPDEEFGRETLSDTLSVMRLDELPSARQIHNPVLTQDDIDDAFDDITYSKGAGVLAMFEAYVGKDDWQKGIHAYLTKFAFKNANARDFITTVAAATNHPEIVEAFDNFIDQPGIPVVWPQLSCTAGASTANFTETPYASVGIAAVPHSWKVPACLTADSNRICQLLAPPSAQVAVGNTCPKTLFPNAKGSGYYRFATDEKGWASFIQNAQALDPADQTTLFHNIDAAMRSGKAEAADYFNAIAALAPVAHWDLIATDYRSSFNLSDSLHDLRVTGVVAPADVPILQAFVRRYFSARLTPLGLAAKPGETVADALLREQLVHLLVEEGRDPALIAQLTPAARAYLASGGKDFGEIAPELMREAMRAAVFSQGTLFNNALLDAIKNSNDEYFVQSAIYAVSGTDDQPSLKKLLDLSLTPAIRLGDLRYVWRYMEAETPAREILWNWLKANFAAVERRVSAEGFDSAPDIMKFACDARSKADLDGFLGPKTSQLEGTPRVLRENDDRIDRCIAFKGAKASEIAAALQQIK